MATDSAATELALEDTDAATATCTKLIDACKKQDYECAKALIDQHKDNPETLAALVNEKDDIQQTPLHIVAENGNIKILVLLKDNNARCSEQDIKKKTPLMIACDSKHCEVVQVLLEMIPKSSEELNLQSKKGFTALHFAALNGSEEIAAMLIEHGAVGWKQDKRKRIPMMCACVNGHKGIVERLLKTGYKNSPVTYEEEEDSTPATGGSNGAGGANGSGNGGSEAIELIRRGPGSEEQGDNPNKKRKRVNVLMKAINRKQEGIAMAILNSIQVRKALEFSRFDRKTHKKKVDALRMAIDSRMPAITERIFKFYTHEVDPGDRDYDKDEEKVTFEYTLLDDLAFESTQSRANNGTKAQRYDAKNHCLNLLVNSDESVKLVRHPLVTSLLYQKWTIYAQLLFTLNFFLHLFFTLSLTVFATTVYQPRSETCTVKNSSSTCDAADGYYISAGVFSGLALALSILRLCFEVFQLVKLWHNYFFDWINYLELLMCIFSVIFVFVYTTECFCPASWQWQIGTLSVFFAWIDFIHFLTIVPLFGIYVVMFGTIVKNFVQVVMLAILLIISFAIPFYMLFNDPLLHKGLRTPFNGVGRSIMKTLTMTTGEFDFDTTFRQGYTEDPTLPYGVSFLFWIAFIVLMPILLNNLLVGLAVDDVNEIRENAKTKTLCIWINYLQLVEQLLPRYLYRKHREKIKPELEIILEDFPKKRDFWCCFKCLEEPFQRFVDRPMWYNALELGHFGTYDNQILTYDTLKDTGELLKEVHKLTTEVETIKKKLCEAKEDILQISNKMH